jgi:uracil-DNA glycosylase
MISRLKMTVFTWNVFPFHPHEKARPLTNRCHTRHERAEVAPILKDLLGMLQPSQLVAIGNDAHSGLEDLGLTCLKVRHPSYGGVSEFRAGVAASHGIKDPTISSQLKLL